MEKQGGDNKERKKNKEDINKVKSTRVRQQGRTNIKRTRRMRQQETLTLVPQSGSFLTSMLTTLIWQVCYG